MTSTSSLLSTAGFGSNRCVPDAGLGGTRICSNRGKAAGARSTKMPYGGGSNCGHVPKAPCIVVPMPRRGATKDLFGLISVALPSRRPFCEVLLPHLGSVPAREHRVVDAAGRGRLPREADSRALTAPQGVGYRRTVPSAGFALHGVLHKPGLV
jgi:hypothetical protein